MEENTIRSGADDQTKPQKKETKQEEVSESSEQADINEVTSVKLEEKNVYLEKKNQLPDQIDLSKLSIDSLINLFSDVTSSENWLKTSKQIQDITNAFEEKFLNDLNSNKKKFIDEGGNEIDFYFKPKYKEEFDQIGYDYRKKRRDHYKSQEGPLIELI